MKNKLKNLICIIFAIQLIFCAGFYAGATHRAKAQGYDTKGLTVLAESLQPIEFIDAREGR